MASKNKTLRPVKKVASGGRFTRAEARSAVIRAKESAGRNGRTTGTGGTSTYNKVSARTDNTTAPPANTAGRKTRASKSKPQPPVSGNPGDGAGSS